MSGIGGVSGVGFDDMISSNESPEHVLLAGSELLLWPLTNVSFAGVGCVPFNQDLGSYADFPPEALDHALANMLVYHIQFTTLPEVPTLVHLASLRGVDNHTAVCAISGVVASLRHGEGTLPLHAG
jgi:hypothetical protein